MAEPRGTRFSVHLQKAGPWQAGLSGTLKGTAGDPVGFRSLVLRLASQGPCPSLGLGEERAEEAHG